MADRYLLIPGTGGVRFDFIDASGARSDAPYVADMLLGSFAGWTDRFVVALSCEHPDTAVSPWAATRTTLVPDRELVPGDVLLGTAYQAVKTSADGTGGYLPWAWDWRLDIRANAIALRALIEGSPDRWKLLCHSQGGLVAAAASRMMTPEGWRARVAGVCFVGTPFVGTARALQAVADGTNFGDAAAAQFRTAARTWPAMHQMLPRYHCIEGREGADILDPGLWGADGAFHALLRRAAGYHAWLDWKPFVHMDPNTLLFAMGRSERPNTRVSARVATDGSLCLLDRMVRGDTLVPFDLTLRFLTWSGLQLRVLPIAGPMQKEHAYLLNDASVAARCDQFLRSLS